MRRLQHSLAFWLSNDVEVSLDLFSPTPPNGRTLKDSDPFLLADPFPEPLVDRLADCLGEPFPDRLAGPLAGPFSDRLAERVAEPLAEPVAEPLAGPQAEPIAGSKLPSLVLERRTYRRTPFLDGAPVAERLVVLDRLRGVALVGVAAVNLSVFVSDAGAGSVKTSLDRVLYWLNFTFLNGKCFPILAAVFGYSLGLALQRPGDVHRNRRVVKRRLLALGTLGLAHGLLLYRFDILLAYALLGMCTYWLRHIRWRALVALCSALVLSGAWLLSNSGIDPSGLVRIGPALAIDRYRYGSLAQLIDLHFHNFGANFSREVVAQWPFVLAMLLLGVFAERFDFARRSTRAQRFTLVGLGAVASVLTVAADLVSGNTMSSLMGFGVTALQPFMSLGVVGVVMVWSAHSTNSPKSIRAHSHLIDAFGRMSLSSYLLQSVVFSLTLYGFGLGLFRWFNPTVQLLFLVGFLTVEMQLAKQIGARFRKGPAEAAVEWWASLRRGDYRRDSAPTPGVAIQLLPRK